MQIRLAKSFSAKNDAGLAGALFKTNFCSFAPQLSRFLLHVLLNAIFISFHLISGFLYLCGLARCSQFALLRRSTLRFVVFNLRFFVATFELCALFVLSETDAPSVFAPLSALSPCSDFGLRVASVLNLIIDTGSLAGVFFAGLVKLPMA